MRKRKKRGSDEEDGTGAAGGDRPGSHYPAALIPPRNDRAGLAAGHVCECVRVCVTRQLYCLLEGGK